MSQDFLKDNKPKATARGFHRQLLLISSKVKCQWRRMRQISELINSRREVESRGASRTRQKWVTSAIVTSLSTSRYSDVGIES